MIGRRIGKTWLIHQYSQARAHHHHAARPTRHGQLAGNCARIGLPQACAGFTVPLSLTQEPT
jgi:hypothetical protein